MPLSQTPSASRQRAPVARVSDDAAAGWTDLRRPAGRVATLVTRSSRLRSRPARSRVVAIHGEELDPEAAFAQGFHLVSTSGGMAWIEPAPSTTSIGGVVAATKRSRPSSTWSRPQVPS